MSDTKLSATLGGMTTKRGREAVAPGWALDPTAAWRVDRHVDEAGWRLHARWWGAKDEVPTTGPREVVIREAPGHEGTHPGGVTSGVMRRLERHLGALTADVQAEAKSNVHRVNEARREAVAKWVADLPGGSPRAGGDEYYAALLDVFTMVGATSTQPINDIAEAMGVSRHTVATQLRTARQRRKEGF